MFVQSLLLGCLRVDDDDVVVLGNALAWKLVGCLVLVCKVLVLSQVVVDCALLYLVQRDGVVERPRISPVLVRVGGLSQN